jgi:hypothetical protein
LGPSQTRFYGDGRKEWGFTRDWGELINPYSVLILKKIKIDSKIATE